MGRSPYDVMNTDDICALPVGKLAAKDCILFMWVTYPKLEEAFEVIKAWGFRYKTCAFTWVKTNRRRGLAPTGEHLGALAAHGLQGYFKWLFHFGLGFWCLSGNTQVHIYDEMGAFVRQVSITQLAGLDYTRVLIHTNKGWRRLKAIWNNGPRETVAINHRLGQTVCTPNHRWAVKHLSFPRIGKSNRRRRLHLVDYLTARRLAEMREFSMYRNNGLNLLFSQTPIESLDPLEKSGEIQLDYDIGWLIGLFCAEGNFSKDRKAAVRFSLNRNEQDIVKRIQTIVRDLELTNERFYNTPVVANAFYCQDQLTAYVYFSSLLLANLIKQFVKGWGASKKHLNVELFLQTTIAFRMGFVEGALAGDGAKTPDGKYGQGYNGYILYATASEKLAHSFSQILLSIADSLISHNTRSNPEICLLATKGKPKRISKFVPNLVVSPLRDHSRKPDEVRDRIVELVGDLPRIELFAREAPDGWDVWGQECPSDIGFDKTSGTWYNIEDHNE